jgi:hypothetical protein
MSKVKYYIISLELNGSLTESSIFKGIRVLTTDSVVEIGLPIVIENPESNIKSVHQTLRRISCPKVL